MKYPTSTNRLYPKWDADYASTLDPVGKLIYRSNLLGSDQRITNTGGGNTSAKLQEIDPLCGEQTEVLWVKGSGGDLRTSKRENFSSLYQQKLLDLIPKYTSAPVKGYKTSIEDQMVGMYPHCTFNLNPRAASIDTPLHAFIPHKHVDHMHPNSVIAIAASKRSEELTKKIWGEDLVWFPWQRPGFDLGLQLQKICQENPRARGVLLGGHGVINWAESDQECYEWTVEIIQKADEYLAQHDKGELTFGGIRYSELNESARRSTLVEILPWLRGQVSSDKRLVATVQDNEMMRYFVNSEDVVRLSELGTSCPDHFLRTKIKPMYVPWDPHHQSLADLKVLILEGLDRYRQDYSAYYERCKHDDSPALRNTNPSVVLIPGLGMIAWGKNKSESRVTAEFYNCALEVMRGAEAVDEYVAIDQQEAFDIEYWLLEEAKLRRMPPEQEMSRQVAVVIGAGSGIGKSVCHRLLKEGSHVVCADANSLAAEATAEELMKKVGVGIGVAGIGLSACGPTLARSADMTNRESLSRLFEDVVLAYGGMDTLIITAGVFFPPDSSGRISDSQWRQTYDVNVIGPAMVAEEAHTVWLRQGLSANLILTSSVNATVSKVGSLAYDSSKAALNHLVRELAIQMAPLVRVNALAPATVVEGSSMFPRERVISSLTKYQLPFDEQEDTESLRKRLADFYAQRTLLKSQISPEHQAEAIFLLASERLCRTTGQLINVDGGLHEAFVR
ncbi:MAG TPA: bifunctional rhamnulose-1-phosphate aldolase/short-chain dehydrogenase [Deltaproteobacteria bacterium]|nr:bifunctional rhamnulose-1-phosphate aldolase/short-chain dehydrogenase [Deltaproteobacteria bacterium]